MWNLAAQGSLNCMGSSGCRLRTCPIEAKPDIAPSCPCRESNGFAQETRPAGSAAVRRNMEDVSRTARMKVAECLGQPHPSIDEGRTGCGGRDLERRQPPRHDGLTVAGSSTGSSSEDVQLEATPEVAQNAQLNRPRRQHNILAPSRRVAARATPGRHTLGDPLRTPCSAPPDPPAPHEFEAAAHASFHCVSLDFV